VRNADATALRPSKEGGDVLGLAWLTMLRSLPVK
jgi:hypothetical protein